MENKVIAVLGATGSVGMQSLDVARKNGYTVDAISCCRDIKKAEEIVREFKVRLCAVEHPELAWQLRRGIRDTGCKVISGLGSAGVVARETEADTVINAVTGIAGLMPTVRTLEAGKNLALANKESLVTAGAYVMALAGKNNKEILPVDSEHCAVWQSLRAGKSSEVKRIILTASGGPFFSFNKEQLAKVTPKDALKHPTWNMGAKITIDSATLVNKGFEIIEAAWLFGVSAEKIDVTVHRESIIHSMVEYNDNMVIAQLGVPDMRSCIQYAITYPDRFESPAAQLDFTKLGKLSFFEPDTETFPLLALAKKVLSLGGSYGAALNGANEEAVRLFLEEKINLPTLFELVEGATLSVGDGKETSLESVYDADTRARAYVRERAGKSPLAPGNARRCSATRNASIHTERR